LLTLQFAAIEADVRAHEKKAAQLLAPDLHEIVGSGCRQPKMIKLLTKAANQSCVLQGHRPAHLATNR
jgi:hypothetical protein